MTEQMVIKELEDYIDLPFGISISDETCKIAIEALEERKQYRAIGTVEELQALKEKVTPKKYISQAMISYCPTCKERLYSEHFNVGYCSCGQRITT